ncbi:MAG: hypothetical protein OEN55_12580 [Alphaproteobacteria bacterium]|nr:hypothetical protein [Alphaproteobacteria bacterium]
MTSALKISVFALIAATAGLLAATPAEALLEKHNCSFCHSLHGGPTSGGSTQFVPEFSPTNVEVLCLGCHFNAVDGSLPPYNSDTDGIPAAAVQPHRSDGSHPEFHVTCIDCHEHHDNLENWLSDPSAPLHQTHDAAFPGIPGVNQKMIGSKDPDGLTPYAVIRTREKDFDRNGIPDRDNTVVQTCNDLIVNDCYTEERRYVVFEQFQPATQLHAWAENTGILEDPFDFLGATDPIVVRTNESDSGALAAGANNWSAHDSLCGMCHTQTANHNLLTGGGLAHNDTRRCTDCHTHDTCFDRSSCGTPVPEAPARDLHVVAGTLVAIPASVSPGQTVTLSVDVENLGDRFEGVDVRFSSDIEGFIGRTRVELDELNSGGEFATASFDWVTSAGGNHDITAQIEPQLSEVDTTNNAVTVVDLVTVQIVHDVAVTSVSAPSPILQGNTETVSVDVANPGGFPETFDVTLVSDLDGTIGTQSSGALASGGSTTLTFAWDTTGATLGTHTLTATAAHDNGDGGTDANSGNDSANTTSVVTVPTHDVAVDSVTAPDTTQGNTVTVSVDVSNPGTFDETFNVTLFDDTEGGTVAVPTQSSGLLSSGATTTLNYDWTPTTLGTHTLRAVADTVPGETITANNTQTTTAAVTAPATVPVVESTVESSGNGTTTTVNTTATRPDNDVYIVVGSKDGDTVWTSIPADWGTAIYDVAMGTQARHTVWAFKGASVPASYTIGHDNEVTEFTFMHLTGANGDDIVEAFNSASGSGTTATAPAATPTNGTTLLIRTFGADRRTLGNSSEGTTDVNVGAGGAGDVSLVVSHTDGPAGGVSTGTATSALSASDEWAAGTLCINPQ